MAERIKFRFLSLAAEAEGIKSVRITALVICAALVALTVIAGMWIWGR